MNSEIRDTTRGSNKQVLLEEEYKTALEAGGVGTWKFDIDSRIFTISDKFKESLGRSGNDSFSYQEFLESIHHKDLAVVQADFERTLADQGELKVEFRIIGSEKQVRWIKICGKYKGASGKDSALLVGLSFDITEQKIADINLTWAQAEAENEKRKIAEVFQQAPSFMCILRGPQHIFERANDNYYELVGKRDILDKTVREALPEIKGQGFYELLDRVYNTGEPFSAVDQKIIFTRGENKTPDVHYLNFVYQPIRNPDGLITGIFVQGVDLTERKQAEVALSKLNADSDKQKRLYETILSSTPDLVYVFDLDYRFTFVNDALLNMWGRTQEDSVGKKLLDVGYEPWHAEMHEREIDKVVETKQPIRGEVPFIHATLGKRIYDYIFVPVLNAQGEVELVAGTTRDITDRKKAEETQRLLLGELNHRVKNTLATIQSIAYQTLNNVDDPTEFVNTFNGRLHALARSHSLLTNSNWEGAYVGDIIRKQLLVEESNENIFFAGPEVFVSSQVALHLALVIFELGTNAHKYGALSVPEGKLSVQWELTGENRSDLKLSWIEEGGPLVSKPQTSGFGMTLIQQSLKSVGGETTLLFNSSGLHCDINLALSATKESDEWLEASR